MHPGVVVVLNEAAERCFGFQDGLVGVSCDLLLFEAAEEAFHESVLLWSSWRREALSGSKILEPAPVLAGRVDGASVRMVDPSFLRACLLEHFVQAVQSKESVALPGERPAMSLACMKVYEDRQMHSSLAGPYLGGVSSKGFDGSLGKASALQEILGLNLCRRSLRRPSSSPAQAREAKLLHLAAHCVLACHEASGLNLPHHPTVSVAGTLKGHRFHDTARNLLALLGKPVGRSSRDAQDLGHSVE